MKFFSYIDFLFMLKISIQMPFFFTNQIWVMVLLFKLYYSWTCCSKYSSNFFEDYIATNRYAKIRMGLSIWTYVSIFNHCQLYIWHHAVMENRIQLRVCKFSPSYIHTTHILNCKILKRLPSQALHKRRGSFDPFST